MEGKAKVTTEQHRHIISLASDLINIVRKGRVKMPKSLGLGVAARNLTGNKELNSLLHRCGHALSYATIQEYEKERVKKLHDGDKNKLVIPSTMRKQTPTTFVWDNNDLCEETLSGEGTTHVTTGILIQRGVRITIDILYLMMVS